MSGTSDVSVIPGCVLTSRHDQLAGFPLRFVQAKIGPADAAAAERAMRPEGQLLDFMVNFRFNFRRKDVDGAALGVFCVVTVKSFGHRLDFDDVEHAVAHDGAGQFLAVDETFGEQPVAIGPVFAADLLGRMRAVLLDDHDAERRALVDRLEHIGRLQRVAERRLVAVDDAALARPARRPPASTILARSFCIASAEASTPEWV